MNVVVLGLGNLIRKDDGVGIHALHLLSADRRVPEKVQIIEGGTLGLDLLSAVKGASHLLALDAVDTAAPPGTLSHFANEDLNNLPVSKSVHLLGFADLLGALRILETAPVEVVLLGIQPETIDWGVTLSPVVDAALNDFVEAALAQIARWNHTCSDAGTTSE
jgi:hydrogenase maturation protease